MITMKTGTPASGMTYELPRLPVVWRVGGGVAVSLRDGGADGGAPLPEFVTPPSNTGVNKVQPVAQGSKQ